MVSSHNISLMKICEKKTINFFFVVLLIKKFVDDVYLYSLCSSTCNSTIIIVTVIVDFLLCIYTMKVE